MPRTRPRDRPLLWAGLTALVCGAVLCVIGWYAISGERFAERQLPYIASCTVPGAALIVAGAVLLARGDREPAPTEEDTGGAEPVEVSTPPSPSAEGPLLRVPGGTLLHRPDCPLVTGKPDAAPPEDPSGLNPCPVCEPPAPEPPAAEA
ncbi:hypothetical protein J7E96_17895 [Streptomyces sp. ISL-96]|uniref:hypothetical protein n=1 Tax=Streptomyces sp. ISL-96 TaxID=2819191 RepID=UPI001BE797B4|nr:hypothetical protein [Streptomyces sp. ISL-96]MBT2490356.1 hypothetical protein [Streptomyces sp. ISL-96]